MWYSLRQAVTNLFIPYARRVPYAAVLVICCVVSTWQHTQTGVMDIHRQVCIYMRHMTHPTIDRQLNYWLLFVLMVDHMEIHIM